MSQLQPRSPAEMYQHYFVPAMFTPWASILVDHAALRPGERMLDVACGTGIVSRVAAPMLGQAGKVAALDYSQPMLQVARALPAPPGAVIEWHEGNASKLPFPDRAFDAVVCQQGLQFVPERAAAVREMLRVLKPHGRAVVAVWQGLEKHPVFEALDTAVARRFSVPLTDVAQPFSLNDADELRDLFEAAGFHKVEILSEAALVHFPDPAHFVPMAVASAAAAVPAFARLEGADRAELIEAVAADVAPTVAKYTDHDSVHFPMFANVAVAIT